MPSLRSLRLKSVCCFSLKTGCKILTFIELFLPPIYGVSSGIFTADFPYFFMVIFALYYLAIFTVCWGSSKKCCMPTCSLIISVILRIILIFSISGWAIYQMVVNIANEETHLILLHLFTLLIELGFGTFTLLCVWSYYHKSTQEPEDRGRIINVQINIPA